MNVLEETIKELETIYTEITFKLQDAEGTSTEQKAEDGDKVGMPAVALRSLVLMAPLLIDVQHDIGSTETRSLRMLGRTSWCRRMIP